MDYEMARITIHGVYSEMSGADPCSQAAFPIQVLLPFSYIAVL